MRTFLRMAALAILCLSGTACSQALVKNFQETAEDARNGLPTGGLQLHKPEVLKALE